MPAEVRLSAEAPPAEPPVNTEGMTVEGNTVTAPATPPVPAAEQPKEEKEGEQTPARPEWLPEDFETPEALAEAYKALRSKMSKDGAPKEGEEQAKPVEGEQANQPTEEQKEAARALTAALAEEAGGEKELPKVIEWARANLSQEDREAFDAACDTGNQLIARMAMQSVLTAYREAVPAEPNLLKGEPAPAAPAVKPYGSRQEVVAAMSDQRYIKGDPAFHREVEARLAVSKVFV